MSNAAPGKGSFSAGPCWVLTLVSPRCAALSLIHISPPTAYELIKRHSFEGGGAALVVLLEEWERWSAELLESRCV